MASWLQVAEVASFFRFINPQKIVSEMPEGEGGGVTVLSEGQLERLADLVAARMAKNPVHQQPEQERTSTGEGTRAYSIRKREVSRSLLLRSKQKLAGKGAKRSEVAHDVAPR